MIEAIIYNKKLRIEGPIVSDGVKFETVKFSFPSEWSGYEKTAVFTDNNGHQFNILTIDAIYFHTTGKADMSKLCSIVYLADAIEPGRDYTGVERLREIANDSLELAVKEYTKMSVEFVKARGFEVHPNTLGILNRR